MTPFYIDFSGYPEAVAKVLFKEVQEHAFELGYKWQQTGGAVEKYEYPILIFDNNKLSIWIDTPRTYKKQISVEEFLEMKKEPEYHVGMPMITESDSISIYIGKRKDTDVFKAIPIKHKYGDLNYTLCCNHDYGYWKPIDPSRIKVTIN